MTATDKPRPAFSAEQALRAPEVSAARLAGGMDGGRPSDQETILLRGIRLMQRVSTGGTMTALERAALLGTARMLEQLAQHCAGVVESLDTDSRATKPADSLPRRTAGRRQSAAKKKTDGGLQ